jgi:putative ABC transport system permease protein
MSRWTGWEVFGKDAAYALRTIRKTPGFSAVAAITLALGIGAGTAIFSVMDAVLLRPLPYPAPKRLVRVWQNDPKMGLGRLGTAPPEFVSYRDRTRAFASLAGYQRDSFDVAGGGATEHVAACRATGGLFPTLGVAPLLGRAFTDRDQKVVVLSHQYWLSHYAENPNVLGTAVRLNEQPYTIVGVMPRRFTFPSTDVSPGEPPSLWVPLAFTNDQLADWASSFDTNIVARLRDGMSLALARDDVRRVAAEFQQEHADVYSGNVQLDAVVEPWAAELGDRVPTVLAMLGAAAGFVLLIACANVANLLLARAGVRRRELSIRRALGASPARLMRQIFAETAILTIAGSMLGCGLAYGLIRIMALLWSNDVNLEAASTAAGMDTRVLGFALALSVMTCFLCGLGPAWSARRPDVNDALKRSAGRSIAGGRRRATRALIFAEIACSVVLLIGSGLLLRSFARVLQIPLGFDPEHSLIVRTAFNRQRYASAERRHAAERAIVARLSALPGVDAVALTTHIPLADQRQIGFLIDGGPADAFHWADNALVSGEYLRVMGIPLLSGRTFSDADTPLTATAAAIVNQSLARQFWPDQNAVGKGLKWGARRLTVIGVAGDIRIEGLDKPIRPTVYNSVYQVESGATTSGVFILRMRGTQDPMRIAGAARGAIQSVDGGLPVLGFSTLHQVVSASLAIRRASLALAGAFAFLAVVLSLIGVYSVLAHAIRQRTQEIGVRLALGATPVEIAGLVVVEGLRLTVWGIVAGSAGGVAAGRLMSKLLFGVRALDPVSFLGGVATILAVALLASYLPARRAARVDPMIALRYE